MHCNLRPVIQGFNGDAHAKFAVGQLFPNFSEIEQPRRS